MPVKKFIHHVRSKPENKRDRYIWIIAGCVTALLIVIWMIVGNGRRATPDENFFDTFNQGLEEGRNTFEENPLEP